MKSLNHITQTYDSIAQEYDERCSQNGGRPLFQLSVDLYEKLTWRTIASHLPQDKNVPILDAGGGTGKWALHIAQRGHHDVRILDMSPRMLEQAQARFAAHGFTEVLTTQVGDIRSLPWPDDSFGLVLSEGDPVGYCLSDYGIAITEMVRVCLAGGVVIVAVDDLLSRYSGKLQTTNLETARQWRKARVSKCLYGLPVRCFTPRELRAAFDAAGADVIEMISKPALMHLLRDESRSQFLNDTDLQQALFEAEAWACEQGYITGGGHLQATARKRNGRQES